MRIEICYKVVKTASVEVDDSYKEMINDVHAWNKLIEPLSETVVNKIRAIENDFSLTDDNVFEVLDAETRDIIYVK